MADQIRTFVALDAGVRQEDVEHSLPRSGNDGVEVIEVVNGLDKAWLALHETSADVLVVACAELSESLVALINGAVRERPSRPVVVLAYGTANGFARRVFAAGADDVVLLPTTPEEVVFILQKAMARKAGASEAAAQTRASLV